LRRCRDDKEAPATITEMAVLAFAGCAELSDLSDKELNEIANRRANEIMRLSVIALAQMRLDKQDPVAKVRNKP
jgi:hypothetical protein